jgi:hypothetical protein
MATAMAPLLHLPWLILDPLGLSLVIDAQLAQIQSSNILPIVQ